MRENQGINVFEQHDQDKVKEEGNRIVRNRAPGHRTLEERAAEYGGKLNLGGELDWGSGPVGNEIW